MSKGPEKIQKVIELIIFTVGKGEGFAYAENYPIEAVG